MQPELAARAVRGKNGEGREDICNQQGRDSRIASPCRYPGRDSFSRIAITGMVIRHESQRHGHSCLLFNFSFGICHQEFWVSKQRWQVVYTRGERSWREVDKLVCLLWFFEHRSDLLIGWTDKTKSTAKILRVIWHPQHFSRPPIAPTLQRKFIPLIFEYFWYYSWDLLWKCGAFSRQLPIGRFALGNDGTVCHDGTDARRVISMRF